MRRFLAFIFTLSIPFLLLVTIRQSWAYDSMEKEVKAYDKEQQRLIAENKRKISGIFVLSKPQRIEKIAVDELNMKKADSSKIIRVSFKQKKKR